MICPRGDAPRSTLGDRLTRIWASLSHLLNITDRECCHSYPEKISIMYLFVCHKHMICPRGDAPRSTLGDRVSAFGPA